MVENIPICAWCTPKDKQPKGKNITHGICPECAKKEKQRLLEYYESLNPNSRAKEAQTGE